MSENGDFFSYPKKRLFWLSKKKDFLDLLQFIQKRLSVGKFKTRIINSLENSHGDSNHSSKEIFGDITYTSCQAAMMRAKGMDIPDSSIDQNIDDDAYCTDLDQEFPSGALDNTVNYWKDHFNELTKKYEVPYMFDGSHTESLKRVIRRKLKEFNEKTCVNLVELPWEEKGSGPFGGKYKNVLYVSLLRNETILFLNEIQNDLSQIIKLTQENARKCSSMVGKATTKQKIRLDQGCENLSTPLHEVMHALGWWHEHQRYARYQSLFYVFSIL